MVRQAKKVALGNFGEQRPDLGRFHRHVRIVEQAIKFLKLLLVVALSHATLLAIDVRRMNVANKRDQVVVVAYAKKVQTDDKTAGANPAALAAG